MGTRKKYVCSPCGYTAEVFGGAACAGDKVTMTMICRECNELVDVPIDINTEGRIQCPRCRGQHLVLWPDARPCPKCNQPMIVDSTIG